MHHRIFCLHFSTVSMPCRTQYCVVSQDDCLLLVLEYDRRGHGHLEPYRFPLVLDQLAPRPYRSRERKYSRKQPVRGHCVGSIATSLHKNVFTYLNIFQHSTIKWKHFSCYWPFVPGIHRSPVNCRSPVKSPHKGQWRGALMFSLICTWING